VCLKSSFDLDMKMRATAESNEDFKHTWVATQLQKAGAALVVAALNIFFIYFTLLRSLNRSLYWQNTFLVSVVLQFIVEVFLNETTEVIWVHVVVPHLASRDVLQAVDTLQATVAGVITNRIMVDAQFRSLKPADRVLDAGEFFSVSNLVAKRFPHLMESSIVLSYQSLLPGPIAKQWKYPSAASSSSSSWLSIGSWSQEQISRSISLALIVAMQLVGASPFAMQRFMVRMMQPWLLASVGLLIAALKTHPLLHIVVALLMLLAVRMVAGSHLWRWFRHYVLRQPTCPQSPGDCS